MESDVDYRQFLHLKTIVDSWFFPSERRRRETATRRWQKLLQGLRLANSHPQRKFTKVPKQRSGAIGGTSYAPDTVTKGPDLSSPLTTQKSQATWLQAHTVDYLLTIWKGTSSCLQNFLILFRIPSTLPVCGIRNFCINLLPERNFLLSYCFTVCFGTPNGLLNQDLTILK